MRKAAEARDRVGGPAQRLFEQRRFRRAVPIGWRPAQSSFSSCVFEQMLPRCSWSISSAVGSVTASDLMLASPGRVVRSKRRPGSALRRVALGPPSWRTVIFGLNGSEKQLIAWKARRSSPACPGRRSLPRRPRRGAVGRVDHEVRAVDVDLDRAHPDRDAADDARHRFGVGDDVGVVQVDVERDPDDDGAVVVGTGQRRGYRHQRQRRAFERARQEDPSDRVERVPAGSRGDVRGADFGARRAARDQLLGPAERLRRRGDRRLRAVGDAGQVAGQPRRHREIELAEELVAVFTVEFEREGAEGAGLGVRGARDEVGVERPDLARALAFVRPRVRG